MQIGDELRHPHLAEQRAAAAIDPHAARRGDPDIAAAVALHAVGHARLQFRANAGGEDAVRPERTVVADVEHPDQRPHRVVDIELPFVGREAEPVRLFEQIALDQELRLGTRNHAVHALESQLARPLDAVDRHAAVPRIGKIDRPVGPHAHVVRAIQLLAFEVRSQDLAPAVLFAYQARGGVFAHHQAEIGVVGHAVTFVRRPHHFAHAAALVPPAAHVGRHVGEQEKLIARMPDRPLGECKAARQPLDRRVEVDQVRELAAQRAVAHLQTSLTPGTIGGAAATAPPVRAPRPAGGRRSAPPPPAPDGRAPAK